jgi:hypothetical protein
MIADGKIALGSLRYYTTLSNLLVGIGFLFLLALYNSKNKFRHYVIFSIMVTISATGLVYNFVLVPFGGTDMIFSDYRNFVTHLFSMILTIINYLAFEEKGFLNFKHILAGCAFPFVYWVVCISLGGITGFYPYFFMNPQEIGWAMTFLWFGIIVFFMFVLWLLFVIIDKNIKKNKSKTKTVKLEKLSDEKPKGVKD